MARGILATSTAKLVPGTTAAQVRDAWEAAYADEPFVHVLPAGQFPRSGDTTGANTALIGLAIDEAAGRVVVVSAIDNLVKGTAGAADPVREPRARIRRDPRPPGERGRAVSVTALPKGFEAAGIAAGLKSSGNADLALVVNRGPLQNAAAVFTSNRAKANPIIWSQQVIADGTVSAIVLNSGGANCFTGAEGFQTTHATAEAVGEALGVSASDVLVCSTGLIGDQLDRGEGARGRRRPQRPLSAPTAVRMPPAPS